MENFTYIASCVVSFAMKAFILAQLCCKLNSFVISVMMLLLVDFAMSAIACMLSGVNVERDGIKKSAQRINEFIRQNMDMQMLFLAVISLAVKSI